MINQKNIPKLFIGAFLAIFFILYSWFYFTSGVFTSPDELSNFIFAQEFSQHGDFVLDRTLDSDYLIRPRSVSINHLGEYVPGGFLGMPLIYGAMATLLGEWSLLITPALIACAGLLALYSISNVLLGESKALLLLVLTALLPPWWYFATRGYLPNVSMVSFLLLSFAVFLRMFAAQTNLSRTIYSILGGIFFFLSLAIRPISFLWSGVLVVYFFYQFKQKVKIIDLVILALIFSLGATVYGIFAYLTYGGFLATGYDIISDTSYISISLFSRVSQIFFPFGIKLVDAFQRFWIFSSLLLLPYLILFAFGIIQFYKKSTEHKKYTYIFIAISLYLILYYGSWQIIDHPDISRVSISISYMRYWIPIYALAVPICLEGLLWLVSKYKSSWWKGSVLLFISLYSATMVYGYQDDNLGEIVADVVNYKSIQATVMDVTESNAIILSSRNDKLFWPSREVIHMNDQAYTLFRDIAELSTDAPIYWMTDLPRSHLLTVHKEYLDPNLLSLGEEQKINDVYRLYRLNKQVR